MTISTLTLYRGAAAKSKVLADENRLGALRSLVGDCQIDVTRTVGLTPAEVRNLLLDDRFGSHEDPETPGLEERLLTPSYLPKRLIDETITMEPAQPEGEQMPVNPNMQQQPGQQQQQGYAQQPQTMPNQAFAPGNSGVPAITAPTNTSVPMTPNPNFTQPGVPGNPPPPPAYAPAQQQQVQPAPQQQQFAQQPQPQAFAQQGPGVQAAVAPDLQAIDMELQTVKQMVNGIADRQERFSNGMNIMMARIMEIHAMLYYFTVRGVQAPWPIQPGQPATPLNMENYKMYFPEMDDQGNYVGPLSAEQVQQNLNNQRRG